MAQCIAAPTGAAGIWRASLPQCSDEFAFTHCVTPLLFVLSVNEEAMQMELTRPLNLLMICAAFAFVGAMVIGVVP